MEVVFAYPFHFGKSGFSATFFTLNPNIRIYPDFYVQAPYWPLYTVSLLLKIKMQ